MRMSTRRKLAIASWSAPREGNIYGKVELDAHEVLRLIEHVRETTGEKVTITHVVGRIVGEALAAVPSLNGRIVFGAFRPHARVDVAYLVALEDGANLAKATLTDMDRKDLVDVARELRTRAEALRRGVDPAFQKSQGPLRMLPTWLIRPLVHLTGWLTGALGLSVPALGLERFPFGGAIVTSVGMLGVDEGYAPPTPWAHVPLYVAVGAVREVPAVVDGAVVPRKRVVLTATLDHRFVDGAQAGQLVGVLRRRFENPWPLVGREGAPPGAGPQAGPATPRPATAATT